MSSPLRALLLPLFLAGCFSNPMELPDAGGPIAAEPSLGECEAMPGVAIYTDDGSATIAGATVESGDCRVQWCTVSTLPDGGAMPCSRIFIFPTSTCDLSFVSTGGVRRRASIEVTASSAPPLHCRVGSTVHEVPNTIVTPGSINLDFPAPDAGTAP